MNEENQETITDITTAKSGIGKMVRLTTVSSRVR